MLAANYVMTCRFRRVDAVISGYAKVIIKAVTRPVLLLSLLFRSSLSTSGCSAPAASSLSRAVPSSNLFTPGCSVVPPAASSPFRAVLQQSLYARVFGGSPRGQFSLPCCSWQQSLYARVFGSSPRGQFSLPCCSAAVSLRPGVRWFPPATSSPSRAVLQLFLSKPCCRTVIDNKHGRTCMRSTITSTRTSEK